jgi:HSP20 family protein
LSANESIVNLKKGEEAMSVIRWKPQNRVDQSFDDLFNQENPLLPLFNSSLARLWNQSMQEGWQPAIDISDEKDHYLVKADLPGVSKDDIKISVQDNVLTIRGERKHESEKKEKNYYRLERAYGAFERRLTLGDVKSEAISAKYQDGVLEVVIPKAESAKPRNIDVKIG